MFFVANAHFVHQYLSKFLKSQNKSVAQKKEHEYSHRRLSGSLYDSPCRQPQNSDQISRNVNIVKSIDNMRPPSLTHRPDNPQHKSNLLSKLTFWYTLKVFRKATKRNLIQSDLTQPLKEHKSDYVGERLARQWSKEVEMAAEKGGVPKLRTALIRCFMRECVGFTAAAIFIELFVRMSTPLFLKALLRYHMNEENKEGTLVKDYNGDYNTYMMRIFTIYQENQGPISKGEAIFFTAGLVFSCWLWISTTHPFLMGMMHLGMKMRIACCSLIYRKALRIKLECAGGAMMGNVVNLLSNDVNRFDQTLFYFPYMLLMPIEVTIVASFLYMEVGIAAVYGILSMIAIIPVLYWFALKVLVLRQKTAVKTDERVKEINELIEAIQVIKMYTWEEIFCNIIYKSRNDEVKYLKKMGYVKGMIMSFIMFSFRLSTFVTILFYFILSDNGNNKITAEKVYVVTTFLLVLRQTISAYVPQGLSMGAELLISILRLEEFLFMEETTVGVNESVSSLEGGVCEIEHASAKFGKDIVVLRNINLKSEPGELTVVIGPVGSGKTCLLHLIMRELKPYEGRVRVQGRISYASQEPWLFPGTVRQNILFGEKYDRGRYDEVCYVCALITDFELLPKGDMTFISGKGTNLSGGQRARINLARAVYKEADIYLLDDPLSAVDTKVSQHLFDECINGYISDKIVILVTHQLQFLENADRILLMRDGEIETAGTLEKLTDAGLDFTKLMTEQLLLGKERPSFVKHSAKEKKDTVHRILMEMSNKNLGYVATIDKDPDVITTVPDTLDEQGTTTGRIKLEIYKDYFRAGGSCFGVLVLFMAFAISQVFATSFDFFMSTWIGIEELRDRNNYKETTMLKTDTCCYILTGLISITIVLSLARSFYFYDVCSRASKNLHNTMLKSVIETRMRFFNANSTGAILNRFSKDIGAIDEVLPTALIDTFQITCNMIGVITVIGVINPFFLIPTFVMLLFFACLRQFYLKISSNVKRLESDTKSPVYAHITSTLLGLPTIRSTMNEHLLTQEFDRHQDIHSSAWFIYISCSRALGYWIDNIYIILFFLIAFSFFIFDSHGENLIGLAITQAINLTGILQWSVRQSVEVENQMVAVERVLQYTKLEPEANLRCDPAHSPPPDWPRTGKVEFSHTFMKYGPQSVHVLNDVSFVIQDKEKVGVVGRTGAGKSSLIATLFKLAYFYGEVRIDNLEITPLCLHDLRRKISIIPQEPVLFNGTLQYNVDPLGEFNAEDIYRTLIEVENRDAMLHGRACLRSNVIEGGANVSVGERQIICLARALLHNNRIIVMDEATANIDVKTDRFIQSMVRKEFANSTVITIAHRLHTIMDSDKILVMEAGQVAEFDHPHVLLQKKDGLFSGMVEKTGEKMADSLRKIARDNYATKEAIDS